MGAATAWAVVTSNGRICVKSVSDTRRAAIINWLVVEKAQAITIFHSDEQIEAMWKYWGQYADCRHVTITPAPPSAVSSTNQPTKRGRGMIISELPRLKLALDLMGVDNGSNVVSNATAPPDWEMRCRLAEDELLQLSPEDMETLTQGECTDMDAVGERAPNAHEILNAAFDSGPLAETFFDPWRSIFDAREAEYRVAAAVSSKNQPSKGE